MASQASSNPASALPLSAPCPPHLPLMIDTSRYLLSSGACTYCQRLKVRSLSLKDSIGVDASSDPRLPTQPQNTPISWVHQMKRNAIFLLVRMCASVTDQANTTVLLNAENPVVHASERYSPVTRDHTLGLEMGQRTDHAHLQALSRDEPSSSSPRHASRHTVPHHATPRLATIVLTLDSPS